MQTFSLGPYRDAVDRAIRAWTEDDRSRRLWEKDASLWTGQDESRWLGWLEVVARELSRVDELQALGREVRAAGFADAVVLGMGGSSLCPDVLAKSFGARPGFPRLHVLDSTVPAQVLELRQKLDLSRTLFIVASKSGSTAEPNAFETYFFDATGSGAGSQFLAITDPGSSLDRKAREKGYRGVLHGEPTIGGRFSALSRFGLGPASILGLDVRSLLSRAKSMVDACGPSVPAEENPGVLLGLALGTLARAGRDKLTFIASPEVRSLGAWLEQLVAESTGKGGKGIVPVDGESLGAPEVYGDDRVFVRIGVGEANALSDLESAGHPSISIGLDSVEDLPAEFFRWEIATAVAGSVLELNPFDQPDVEASKVATRALTKRFEETGELPATAERGTLEALLSKIAPGDYFAVNAFVAMNDENDAELQALRHAVRDAKRVATTVGYGPRFLHSTGQLHKGGPNRGVFLHVTSDDAADVAIPGQSTTFGRMKTFQAAGDYEVLLERGRRAISIQLGPDVPAGLRELRRSLEP